MGAVYQIPGYPVPGKDQPAAVEATKREAPLLSKPAASLPVPASLRQDPDTVPALLHVVQESRI